MAFAWGGDLRGRHAARPYIHNRPIASLQILRNSRISVTMEIYTESTSEATRDALGRLGDSLGS